MLKEIITKIKIKTVDYWHILFKSAAVNHLRIQDALKNPDGTYQVTLKFASYTDLKKYQRKMRRLTVSLSSAVAMVIVAVIVAPYVLNPNRSSAGNYAWMQTKWDASVGATNAPASSTETIDHPADSAIKSSWVTKDAGIAITTPAPDDSSVMLTEPTPQSVDETGYTGVSLANTYVDTSNANALTLKKPSGFLCGGNNECLSAVCGGSPAKCVDPCSASTVCGTIATPAACSYNGDVYNTIQIGTQCWFAENLRTTKKADGVTDITAVAYCNPAGCGSPWGRLYSWPTAMNISSTYESTAWNGVTTTGAKIQGICPTGWHIPSDYNANVADDMQKLSNYLGGDAAAGGKMKLTGTTYWTTPNTGATNSSGFAGVAAGEVLSGTYSNRGNQLKIWISTDSGSNGASYGIHRYLLYNSGAISRYTNGLKRTGLSVRCVKD